MYTTTPTHFNLFMQDNPTTSPQTATTFYLYLSLYLPFSSRISTLRPSSMEIRPAWMMAVVRTVDLMVGRPLPSKSAAVAVPA